MDEKHLYPYLILLPDDPKIQKKILTTIFGSEIAQALIINISSSIKNEKFQKELIKELKYSNKTIIQYLKNLVELNILEEYSNIVEGHRLLSYKLTEMGEWFSRIIIYRKRDPKELKEILEELFEMYLKHAIGLLIDNKFKQDDIREIFERTLSLHLKEGYIEKLAMDRYIGNINSLNKELQSILSSIEQLDKEKKKDLLKITELKETFVEIDEFYGILKNIFQKLKEKLKNY